MVNRNDVVPSSDTTYTKIFVGGLAWETQRDTLKSHFDQFGEILEAVVISDKISGKSKGYGFVTFRDPESAWRACQNPYPVIDGRRANCNLASLGAQKNRFPANQRGLDRSGQKSMKMPSSSFNVSPTYFPRYVGNNAFTYSTYGYPSYAHDVYPTNYYNLYGGGQNVPSYYPPAPPGSSGFYLNYYPYYIPHGQSSMTMQFPKLIRYPQLSPVMRAVEFSPPPTTTASLISGVTAQSTVSAAIPMESRDKPEHKTTSYPAA